MVILDGTNAYARFSIAKIGCVWYIELENATAAFTVLRLANHAEGISGRG